MANTTTFSAAMKTRFIGPIRDQLYSNKILLFGLRDKQGSGSSDAPQGTVPWRGIQAMAEGIDFVGNEFRIPLRTGRNSGVGSRAENAVLPAPGNESFTYISDPLRFHYGLFNITGQLLKASESNEGAFKRALTVEMDGVTDALKRKVNIDAFGDGTGAMGVLTAATTAAVTVTLDTTVALEVGDIVDVVDTAGPTYKANARTVTAINRTTLVATLSGANFTAAIGDKLIRASSDSTSGTPNNDLNAVTNGLRQIVSATGTLHGVAQSSNAWWASTAIAAGGAVVGDNLLRQLTDTIGRDSGDEGDLVYITTRGIRNRYANTLTALKRFNDAQSVTLHGGFKALLFDEKPIVVDDALRPGYVYALNAGQMFWSQMSDWEWLEEDGKALKWESRYDRYIGVLFKYCNFGTFARNRHGVITGADDDVR